MKKHTRMLALILCCTLLFTQAPAYAYGTQLHASQLTLANGAVLRSVVSKLPNGERQSSNFIEYTPNTDVTPIVAYGSKIYGRSDINTVASYVESQGMSVVGGVNGDYYVLDTGVPMHGSPRSVFARTAPPSSASRKFTCARRTAQASSRTSTISTKRAQRPDRTSIRPTFPPRRTSLPPVRT